MYALIENDTIVNIIACDQDFADAQGLTLISQTPAPGIGWTLQGDVWTEPPPLPPPAPRSGIIELVNGTVTVESNALTTQSVVLTTAQATTIVGRLQAVPGDGMLTITSTVGTDHGNAGWAILSIP